MGMLLLASAPLPARGHGGPLASRRSGLARAAPKHDPLRGANDLGQVRGRDHPQDLFGVRGYHHEVVD
eukprot:CAMPEP_0179057534 /NCGR_PEP_ID=MMETSP0796-20121207/24383_1 /TAXON_ID=73915 /ORGANISM="Pyrodinium bahamense, Strain pbaha01" /LENGTH=67 /DNA_ID=CAMNT_0020754255 /DNA_START=279 /DNA_END=479 /DNA_ORIENTATION=-